MIGGKEEIRRDVRKRAGHGGSVAGKAQAARRSLRHRSVEEQRGGRAQRVGFAQQPGREAGEGNVGGGDGSVRNADHDEPPVETSILIGMVSS